jgi:hypothetical protein
MRKNYIYLFIYLCMVYLNIYFVTDTLEVSIAQRLLYHLMCKEVVVAKY